MDSKLINSILDHDFYTTNKHLLSRTLFDDEIQDLYDVITEAHDRYQHSLTIEEVYLLWQSANPTATRAEIRSMGEIVTQIKSEDAIPSDIARDLIRSLWTRDVGKRIANLGIAISEGKEEAFTRLKQLVLNSEAGVMPDEFGEPTTDDLDLLLAATSNENRFRFNIPGLSKHVYGIGRGEFGAFFATPETGKTAMVVSLMAGPGGFCEQGAKVLYLGNEEDTKRTMLRAYQAYTGFTRDEIVKYPQQAKKKFEAIKSNLIIKDAQGMTIQEVEAYTKHIGPDIVIIDQYDKIHIPGNYDGQNHLRLRELYTQLREYAKRQNIALLGLSQASDQATGRTILTPNMMENSRIGKAAELDLIIGIGKIDEAQDGTVDPIRYLYVGKNKLSGFHGQVIARLQTEISRYTD